MRKWFARLLSQFYRLALWFWQSFYRWMPSRVAKVNAKVISVGNITWGGTGKTPLVARLAGDLVYYGKKVAILIRGYGHDEVEELRRKIPGVPILMGRDRVKSAREAVQKYGAEFLLLDDGFQHLRLHRNLDIVNINSTSPFGPGGLLPEGTLREPIENLSRAHIFVLTKCNIGSKNLHWIRQKLLAVKPDAVIFEAVHKPVKLIEHLKDRHAGLSEMKGRRVAALSAVGDPYSFEKTIEKLGSEIALAVRFEDHHAFTPAEIMDFAQRCREMGLREVITTEKDFMRLEMILKRNTSPVLASLNFWTLQIEFEVDNEEDFVRRCLNS